MKSVFQKKENNFHIIIETKMITYSMNIINTTVEDVSFIIDFFKFNTSYGKQDCNELCMINTYMFM